MITAIPPTNGIKPATYERRRALYEDACRILEQEYRADLQVEQVARRVASSRRQLQRSFAQAGTSFDAELRRIRIDRAMMLLRSTDQPVARIAASVGYRQPSQFAKAFRRRLAQSPSEFRARSRSGAQLDRAA